LNDFDNSAFSEEQPSVSEASAYRHPVPAESAARDYAAVVPTLEHSRLDVKSVSGLDNVSPQPTPSRRQAWSRDINDSQSALASNVLANSQQSVPISELIKLEYKLLFQPTAIEE
jgi:hypothetical protein